MTALPQDLGAVTEFFRLGLVSRTLGPSTVDSWATDLVASSESPSFLICDLAMANTTDRAILLDTLRLFPRTEEERATGWAIFCKHLCRDLISSSRSTKDTIYALYGLERLHEAPNQLEIPITILEDEYALARDGIWGTMEEIQERTMELLQSNFDASTPEPPEG